jgi:hypothetical protein
MSETLFTEVRYDLESLVKFIALGELALPDLQRPFVWSNAKIRDLFDSMYRGYPVGFLLFWQTGLQPDTKAIGTEGKQKPPRLLIVDGQQRLTSLYAVLRGEPVVREDYSTGSIEIAFDPLTQEFQVGDAATRKDKTILPDISILWATDTSLFDLVRTYLDGVSAIRPLEPGERQAVEKSIQRLYSLRSYPFTALELASNVDDDQVAEVFVRVNSQGKSLVQSDFILTLMSVYWDEGRKQLEQFCRDAKAPKPKSPHNHFIKPSPDQLLRIAVGLGFQRARLKHVYSLLRGKDLDTGAVTAERRAEQFQKFKEAQAKTLDLAYWHGFFNAIRQAGYRSDSMISSETAVVYSYVLYLIGKTTFNVEENELRKVIAQWFFMSSLTARYSSSPESKMEFDLARLREVRDAAGFLKTLQAACDEELTGDFWSITLPGKLATSAARSPALFAYYAALVLIDARVLFSKQKVSDLLDPSVSGARSAVEKHHLFPKAHLEKSVGVSSPREVNQIGNMTLVEWGDNAKISKDAPAKYVPVLSRGFSQQELLDMHVAHALPDGWESMDYSMFLEKRRELMARVIRNAYGRLVGTEVHHAKPLDIESLVEGGEGTTTEFKSTLRTNLHTRKPDPKMEFTVLRTIAGFLNAAAGGTLVIGVSDDGSAVGVAEDGFESEDKMLLHFDNLLKDRIGGQFTLYVHPHFAEFEDKRVLVINVKPAGSPAFMKDGDNQRFFVRAGASTAELTGLHMQQFIGQRFK